MTEPGALHKAGTESWFAAHMPEVRLPLHVTQIAGGYSNLTFRVEDAAGTAFVLGRPPLGELPPGAHDMAREHRIQAALWGHVPVAPMLGLCTDLSVTGAPFYVMGWVNGEIIDRPTRVELLLPDASARRTASFALVDTMTDVHRVNIEEAGLGDLGPRENFARRVLDRTKRVWDRTKTRDLPLIDELFARLSARLPAQHHTGLVHGDYRFGNVMLAGGCPVAVLDWELCSLGDVLMDLAFLLNNWELPADLGPNIWMETPPSMAGQFPTREDLVARYVERTGFDTSSLNCYRALAYWRIAIIAEGIKRRYETRAMGSHPIDLAALDRRVCDRAAMAQRMLEAA